MVTSNTFAIRKATATQRLETMTETEKDLEYKAFRKRLANDEPLTQSDVDRLDPMGERCSGEGSPTQQANVDKQYKPTKLVTVRLTRNEARALQYAAFNLIDGNDEEELMGSRRDYQALVRAETKITRAWASS